MPKSIEAKNLTKHFGGNTAVDDLSADIADPKTTGLIGVNWSGKTTLADIDYLLVYMIK